MTRLFWKDTARGIKANARRASGEPSTPETSVATTNQGTPSWTAAH